MIDGIVGIDLVRVEFERLLPATQLGDAYQVRFKPEWTEIEEGPSIELYKHTFSVGFRVVLEIFRAETDTGVEAVGLRVAPALQLMYGSVEPTTDEERNVFVHTSGLLHAWPYIRELVHSFIVRAGYPAFLLPLLWPADRRELVSSPDQEPLFPTE